MRHRLIIIALLGLLVLACAPMAATSSLQHSTTHATLRFANSFSPATAERLRFKPEEGLEVHLLHVRAT